jgi:hypothetical protein
MSFSTPGGLAIITGEKVRIVHPFGDTRLVDQHVCLPAPLTAQESLQIEKVANNSITSRQDTGTLPAPSKYIMHRRSAGPQVFLSSLDAGKIRHRRPFYLKAVMHAKSKTCEECGRQFHKYGFCSLTRSVLISYVQDVLVFFVIWYESLSPGDVATEADFDRSQPVQRVRAYVPLVTLSK